MYVFLSIGLFTGNPFPALNNECLLLVEAKPFY